jgi:imidazolonepropionase-like amidohydrolase
VQTQFDHADRMGHAPEVVSNLKRILDRHAASLVKAHQIGVTIIAGSDAGSFGVPHGLGLLDELQLMERAGLAPLTVLNAATGVPSQRLAFKDRFGQIRPGFRARFILTAHSPMDSVTNLQKPGALVFDDSVLPTDASLNPSGL